MLGRSWLNWCYIGSGSNAGLVHCELVIIYGVGLALDFQLVDFALAIVRVCLILLALLVQLFEVPLRTQLWVSFSSAGSSRIGHSVRLTLSLFILFFAAPCHVAAT